MDETQFNDAVTRLRQINDVIESLDPAIRSAAFEILSPYVDGEGVSGNGAPAARKSNAATTKKAPSKKRSTTTASATAKVPPNIDQTTMETFVRTSESKKPSDYVYAIVGWWFRQYGSAPITTAQLRAFADEIGVTLPARPDTTLLTATGDGKPLFRRAGGGIVPIVPHGELYLREKYGIEKGTKAPPAADAP